MAQSDTYLDPAAPIDDRVNDLLARLSVQEKAGQLTQYFYLRSMHPASDGADSADLPTEHRRPPSQPAMVEAEIRAGRAGSVLFVRDPATRNELQRLAVEHGPHRIPLIFGYDVIHGLRTIMPVPIAMAASWDPAVLEAAQASAAEQARAVGISWTFAPMVDIARDPRWGRIVEGAGEDPYLGAACAAAQVRGFQGGPDIGREGRVLAGPKHFAGYGAARGGRDYEDSEISDNELWNVYLPPFKAAVDAGAGNVMSAYMDLCGVPACGNRWLLTDVLRGTFGFEGFVVSDADAVQSLTTQHFAEDLTDAGARALMAGLDMEMGRDDAAYKRLPEALGAGLITVEALDTAVRRVLRAKFAMGLFENPYVDVEAAPAVLADPAHRRVARTAAESTLVLLKNRPGPDGARVLPLGARGSIAVVGQLADSPRDTLGPWVFDYDPAEVTTILAGIRERAGSDVRVDYAVGEWAPPRRFPSDPTTSTTRPPSTRPCASPPAPGSPSSSSARLRTASGRRPPSPPWNCPGISSICSRRWPPPVRRPSPWSCPAAPSTCAGPMRTFPPSCRCGTPARAADGRSPPLCSATSTPPDVCPSPGRARSARCR